MTDNEIIKALEDKIEFESFDENGYAVVDIEKLKNALSLINRQKAEIERLQSIADSFTDIGKLYSEIKAEAYQNFWQEAKQKGMHPEDISDEFAIPRSFFDKVYERLVGELNG